KSYQEAEGLYRDIARLFPTAHLPERRSCWLNLGHLHLSQPTQPNRLAAREALREARHCAEQMRGLLSAPELRQRIQGTNAPVYDAVAWVSLGIWRDDRTDVAALREAVEVAEQGRSRNLIEMLGEEALAPANTPPGLAADYRGVRKQLRQAWLRLQQEENQAE